MVDSFLSTVKWLHVELSSRCNAWCPSCPRNIDGYKLAPNLIEQDLPLEKLVSIVNSLPSLETIQLNGNLGDPIASKNVSDVFEYLIGTNLSLEIHTNGSLKTSDWWKDLGNKLKNNKHKIYFALDGLEDTHEIHRQGTNFNKIINNAQSFIEGGGYAIWKFIPFAHNEHQIKKALSASKKLKFKEFIIVKRPRVNTNAKHYKTGELLNLQPYSAQEKFNNLITDHNTENKFCAHVHYPSLYVHASGKISPCCIMDKVEYTNNLNIEEELNTSPREICKTSCRF